MAKIYGIELKAHKLFAGHDDEPRTKTYHMGNLYMDGKKLGEWSQDAWCGPDHFNMPKESEKALFERCEQYYKEYPSKDWHLLTLDQFKAGVKPTESNYQGEGDTAATFLIWDLILLNEEEKHYKKFTKQGYDVMGVINYHNIMRAPIPRRGEYAEGLIMAYQKKDMQKLLEFEKQLQEKYPYGYLKIYRSLDDFEKH